MIEEVKVDIDIPADPSTSLSSLFIVPPMPLLVEVEEFGLEQLLARIPVTWDEQKDEGVSQTPFKDIMFAYGMDE
jgi:hypothetical protein